MKTKRTQKGLAALLALVMVLFAVPFTANAANGQTYRPTKWEDVQNTVNSMSDGDILDLNALTVWEKINAGGLTVTVQKNITITANDQEQLYPFKGIHFVLENADVTMRELRVENVDALPVISGTGNLSLDYVHLGYSTYEISDAVDSQPEACIKLAGNVTVHGTMTPRDDGNVNFTTWVTGKGFSDAYTGSFNAGNAIEADNVTVYGGNIDGGLDYSGRVNGGSAIVAKGDVVLKGTPVWSDVDYDVYNSAALLGGRGWNGGHAIEAGGNVFINGGSVFGGEAVGDSGFGGSAVKAAGNVTIIGEQLAKGDDTFFTTYLFSGHGTYCPGVPIVLTGNDNTPGRILRIKNAQVLGRNSGSFSAAYTIDMKKNDIAVIDGSKIGWYSNIPIFSGGSYQLTNPFATWGTLDNATTVNVIDGLVSPDGKSTTITATATIPSPTYTVTIPGTVDAGDLVQKAEADADKVKSTTFSVSASSVENLFGAKKVVVSLSTADGTFALKNEDDSLEYAVYNQETGGTALTSGANFTEFTSATSVIGRVDIDQSKITKKGDYTGTMTFRISLADIV